VKKYYDQAVGAYEAACLMGVHFTVPRRMVDKGILTGHIPNAASGRERVVAIFDVRECEKNFAEYEERVAALGGKSDRRPRGWLHLRPDAIARLTSVETRVPFSDAMTLDEAASEMGVHPTLVARLLRERRLAGRVCWTRRGGGGRLWIVSRNSVRENIRTVKSLEAAGKKRGVRRQR